MRRDWPAPTVAVLIEVHDSDEDYRCDLVAYPLARDGRQAVWEVEWVAERLELPPGDEASRAELVGRCAAAGAGEYPYPLYVSPHDSVSAYEVATGRWIDDVAIWGDVRFAQPAGTQLLHWTESQSVAAPQIARTALWVLEPAFSESRKTDASLSTLGLVPLNKEELRQRIEVYAVQLIEDAEAREELAGALAECLWPTIQSAQRDSDALQWLRSQLDDRFPDVAAELNRTASGTSSAW